MGGALNGDGRWGYPVASARPRRKTFATATSVGFTFVAVCVTIIFFSGHRSMQRMHGALQSPLMEHPPPGWALMHKTTTVQSATVTISTGETAITGSALTATTTTTTGAADAPATAELGGAAPEQAAAAAAAAGAAAAAVGAAGVAAALPAVGSSSGGSGVRAGFGAMLGDLQHSLHALLTANAGWRPGQRVTRAQLAAAAAASMQDEGRDIELQPHKVAAVLDRAKAQQELQALAAQQGLQAATGAAGVAAGITAAGAGATQELSAEAYAGLYGKGGGTVVFSPHADLDSCPEGSATPNGAAAAVVLLAGSSAAALKRSADSLLLLYGQAAPDIRAAFHLFIGLDSEDAELRSLAHTYALDSLGALKLVHHSSSSEHVSSNKKYDEQQQAKAAAAAGTAGAAAGGGEQPGTATQRRLLDEPATAQTTTATPQQQQQQQQQEEVKPQQQQEPTQQAAQAAAPHPRHGRPPSRPPSRVRAQHLRLMLHVFLDCFGYPGVLLLEDDLALAPDLLEFFAASHWLLGSDSSSLFCLSAWNPLGVGQAAARPGRLLRADTMPGRAWLITREVGRQLLASWPNSTDSSGGAFDWQVHVNSDEVRQGRQCVVPELPRVVPAAGADEAGAGDHPQGAAADASPAVSGPAAATGQTTAAAAPAAATTAVAGGGAAAAGAAAAKPAAASAAGGLDEGSVDMDAYLDEEEPDTPLDEQEGGGEQDQQQQQQQQQHVAADRQGQPQAAAVAAGAAGRRRAWLQRDLSLMLEENYRPYMQQLLLAAAPCDVVTAATTADRAGACVVTYSSGQYLSAAAERLGIPLEVMHGQQYCVILPTPPGATQALLVCEKFMPQMAYHSIVAGYNRYGVRVFLVHEMYLKTLRAATEYALQQLQQQQAQQQQLQQQQARQQAQRRQQ